MTYYDDDQTTWHDDDDDDEFSPPRPLKQWKKRELRDEVVQLREREAELRRHITTQANQLLDLRTYAQANHRHEVLLERVHQLFRGKWRIVDMDMSTENADTVEVSTLNSLYSQTVGGSVRGVLTLELALCPPQPEEIS